MMWMNVLAFLAGGMWMAGLWWLSNAQARRFERDVCRRLQPARPSRLRIPTKPKAPPDLAVGQRPE